MFYSRPNKRHRLNFKVQVLKTWSSSMKGYRAALSLFTLWVMVELFTSGATLLNAWSKLSMSQLLGYMSAIKVFSAKLRIRTVLWLCYLILLNNCCHVSKDIDWTKKNYLKTLAPTSVASIFINVTAFNIALQNHSNHQNTMTDCTAPKLVSTHLAGT